ncbi:uncharacterized protein B0H18DRAFT_1002330 [Fomitopsis serialis]|uniref:uncharacterized protein n=1 Tax=Fomitopsis serialis TaxID=139415 RepID=UPI0020075E65|nr:uncharacterized protein B0H18DRAFT_1002330 [Neoantrodia serialis]KAH9927811.1 hypothetical protein B0H18DRAFT_1002330 [Neoantrodia serialis]
MDAYQIVGWQYDNWTSLPLRMETVRDFHSTLRRGMFLAFALPPFTIAVRRLSLICLAMHATAARRRFDKSLDMVAARPELFVDLVSSPSSTDNAWSMLESPILGRDVVQGPRTPFEEAERSPLALAPVSSALRS